MRDFQKFGKTSISAREMEKRRSALREKMDKTGAKAVLKPAERGQKRMLRVRTALRPFLF